MKPELIVFDLDFTLWNAGGTWCDHTLPPYRRVDGYVEDASHAKIILYPDSRAILDELHGRYLLGIASRTHQPSWARELMELFGISAYFRHVMIFPGSKTSHFRQLRAETGKDYRQMVFFDDEMRNVREVSQLGVKSVLVEDGISMNLVRVNI